MKNYLSSQLITFILRFVEFIAIYSLYGPIFASAYSFFQSLIAINDSICSFVDISTNRFFHSFSFIGKLNWIFGAFIFRFTIAFLFIVVFYYNRSFLNSSIYLNPNVFYLFCILFSLNFLDSLLSFIDRILVLSGSEYLVLYRNLFFFVIRCVFIGFNLFFHVSIIDYYLLGLYIYICFFVLCIFYILFRINSKFILTNFKYINFNYTIKLYLKIFVKYSYFDFIKIPISYLKSNVLGLVAPFLFHGNDVFVANLIFKLQSILTFLIGKFIDYTIQFKESNLIRYNYYFKFINSNLIYLIGLFFFTLPSFFILYYFNSFHFSFLYFYISKNIEFLLVLAGQKFLCLFLSISKYKISALSVILPDVFVYLLIFILSKYLTIYLYSTLLLVRSGIGLYIISKQSYNHVK